MNPSTLPEINGADGIQLLTSFLEEYVGRKPDPSDEDSEVTYTAKIYLGTAQKTRKEAKDLEKIPLVSYTAFQVATTIWEYLRMRGPGLGSYVWVDVYRVGANYVRGKKLPCPPTDLPGGEKQQPQGWDFDHKDNREIFLAVLKRSDGQAKELREMAEFYGELMVKVQGACEARIDHVRDQHSKDIRNLLTLVLGNSSENFKSLQESLRKEIEAKTEVSTLKGELAAQNKIEVALIETFGPMVEPLVKGVAENFAGSLNDPKQRLYAGAALIAQSLKEDPTLAGDDNLWKGVLMLLQETGKARFQAGTLDLTDPEIYEQISMFYMLATQQKQAKESGGT